MSNIKEKRDRQGMMRPRDEAKMISKKFYMWHRRHVLDIPLFGNNPMDSAA